MSGFKQIMIMCFALAATQSLFAQKKGTLVIEPDPGPLLTTLGSTVTDAVFASQLCDSLSTVQSNYENLTVTAYEITLETTREVTWKVEGNQLPDTLCQISEKLRGGEMLYIERVVAIDSNSGKAVMLPPVRLVIRKPESVQVINR